LILSFSLLSFFLNPIDLITVSIHDGIHVFDSITTGSDEEFPIFYDLIFAVILAGILQFAIRRPRWKIKLFGNPFFISILVLIVSPLVLISIIIGMDFFSNILFTEPYDLLRAKIYVVTIPSYFYLHAITDYYNRAFMEKSKKYFTKYGYESAIIDHKFVKYVFTGSSIIAIIFLILINLQATSDLVIPPNNSPYRLLIISLWSMNNTVAIASFAKMGSHLIDKEFRFYFSIAFFKLVLLENTLLKKIKLTVNGLDSYNKFLNRNMGLKLANTGKLASFMFLEDEKTAIVNLNDFAKEFLKEDPESPLRYISNKLDKTDFLTKPSQEEKIREFIAPLIAIIASIVSLVVSVSSFFTNNLSKLFGF